MKYSKEIKIALVAIVGIVVMFFGMNFLKGLDLFSSDDSYYIEFKDVTGLSSSSPIYANGYPVGEVRGIDFDYEQKRPTRVEVGLRHGMQVPVGTTAEITSDMLGNVRVNLLLAPLSDGTIDVGGVIKGGLEAGVVNKVSSLVPAIEKMLPKLDSIMASLNVLLADPAIGQSLHNIETVTADLTTSTRELNTLMNSLNQNVPGLMAKADGVLDNTQRLTGNLAAVDIEGTMNKVDKTLANVQDITDQLKNNKGSLGLLMNDPGLYNNLNATLSSADSLLVNLKAHPKRYVHFSLFGKKDK